jgi:hypothetical protein
MIDGLRVSVHQRSGVFPDLLKCPPSLCDVESVTEEGDLSLQGILMNDRSYMEKIFVVDVADVVKSKSKHNMDDSGEESEIRVTLCKLFVQN